MADLDNTVMVLGCVLWAPKYEVIYKNRIYANVVEAQRALDGVVWHNRHEYELRLIQFMPGPTSGRAASPEEDGRR